MNKGCLPCLHSAFLLLPPYLICQEETSLKRHNLILRAGWSSTPVVLNSDFRELYFTLPLEDT